MGQVWQDDHMIQPVRPEDILPDDADTASFAGNSARKGTIAAFVANAKLLDELAHGSPEREAVLTQLRLLAPGVRGVGLLDVFTPRSPENRRPLH